MSNVAEITQLAGVIAAKLPILKGHCHNCRTSAGTGPHG